MKLDKRFILAASLVLGLGLGFQACSDDDDSSDEAKTECKVSTDCKDKAKPVCTAGKCVAETATDTNACKDKTEGADCGEGKTCQKGTGDKLECKAQATDTDPCKDKKEGESCGTDKTCQKGAGDKLECKAQATDTDPCKDKKEGESCGTDKTCQKGTGDKLECKAKATGGSDGAKCTRKNGNKDCSGDTPVCLLETGKDEGKCIAAETKECIKSANCKDATKPICSDNRCVAESEATACAETDPKCAEGKFCNKNNNKCEDTGKPGIATCGDGKVDVAMKEICDRDKGGSGVFPDELEMTCEKYMEMMSIPNTATYNKKGKPGCSKDCLEITKGSCNIVTDTCEGDNWKDGDTCRVIGGKTMIKDGESTREATCNDYQKDSGMTGMPGCAKDCKGLAKGECKVAGE